MEDDVVEDVEVVDAVVVVVDVVDVVLVVLPPEESPATFINLYFQKYFMFSYMHYIHVCTTCTCSVYIRSYLHMRTCTSC